MFKGILSSVLPAQLAARTRNMPWITKQLGKLPLGGRMWWNHQQPSLIVFQRCGF